mmetsp:Transcript_10234/g.22592  ORF Transcript_10234/g.22592 Transcript_10234/m.22592 type:complete len:414 (-) Transcript_10234:46-1287(-)
MSLLSSIFGKGPAKEDDGKGGLFSSAVIPKVLHSKKAAPSKAGVSKGETKSKKAKNKCDDVGEQNVEKSDGSDDDASSEGSKKEVQDDGAEAAIVQADDDTKGKLKQTEEERLEEEKRTIFVGNLPPDISRRALAGIFKPCGTVTSARLRSMAVAGVKLPPDQAGNQNLMRKVCANTGKLLSDNPKKSAQGYVVFKSVDSVEEALKLNNTTYETHTIRVDHATPTVEPSRSVFIGNLPYGAEEETLRDLFLKGVGADGDDDEDPVVSGVRIVRDKETQKCKGFAYVTFRDASFVALALNLHESKYMKREIRVQVCGKRTKGKKGDGINNKRSFEGQRATTSGKLLSTGKRKAEGGEASSSGGGKTKRRRARSEKKTGPASKSGLSKRAATEKKVKTKVKKLQQRAAKGMGKKK